MSSVVAVYPRASLPTFSPSSNRNAMVKPTSQALNPARTIHSRLRTVTLQKAENVWSCISKVIHIVRRALLAAANTKGLTRKWGPMLPFLVDKIVLRLKLFSIIGVLFDLQHYRPLCKKIYALAAKGEIVESICSVMSLSIMAVDGVDSVATVVNAGLNIAGKKSVQVLSSIGLPAVFYILSASIALRTYRLIGSIKQLRTTTSIPVRDQVKREVKIHLLSLKANAIALVGVSLLAASVAGPIPYLLVGGSFALRLGIQILFSQC